VSKWEADGGIPELDTLIAMSRLFEVTLGQLLGIEEAGTAEKQEQDNEESSVRSSEELLRKYTEMLKEKSPYRRPGLWAAAVALIIVFAVLFSHIGSLKNTVNLLRSQMSNLESRLSSTVSGLSGQIRHSIYDILAEKENILSTFRCQVLSVDARAQTVELGLEATAKEYTAGSLVRFCADWELTDGTAGSAETDPAEGPDFSAVLTLPMNVRTDLSVRLQKPDGSILEQSTESIYYLHPDNFSLYAENLMAPFTVTVKGRFSSTQSVRAEEACITLSSPMPEHIFPAESHVSVYVNDEEVFSENLDFTHLKGGEFRAFLSCGYFEIVLTEGDRLEVILTVTDNLGRISEFSDGGAAGSGGFDRTPMAVPAKPMG